MLALAMDQRALLEGMLWVLLYPKLATLSLSLRVYHPIGMLCLSEFSLNSYATMPFDVVESDKGVSWESEF